MDNDLRKNLIQLQNKTKRDPEAYRDEFESQLRHFDAYLQDLLATPQKNSPQFIALLQYIAQVTQCYKDLGRQVPAVLCKLLDTKLDALHPEIRREIAKALVLLRNRDQMDGEQLLMLLFKLLRLQDKKLRTLILCHMVGDVKRLAKKTKGDAAHKRYQALFQKMLNEDDATGARYAQMVLIELYRRQIWTTEHVANIIARGCLSRHIRIVIPAMRFLLGQFTRFPMFEEQQSKKKLEEKERLGDDADDDEVHLQKHKAIQNLYDPQMLAERLFGRLQKTTEKFDVRLLMMNVIARLISAHTLHIPAFYSYLERYTHPSVGKVTNVLAIAAESVHDQVDAEEVRPLLMSIVNHFVTDKVSPDAITVGLHTVTKMCQRNKDIMTKTLLRDLVQYRTYKKDKGIVMAARRLLRFFRDNNPDLLKKRDRGKPDAPEGVDAADLEEEEEEKDDESESGDEAVAEDGTTPEVLEVEGMEEDEDEEGEGDEADEAEGAEEGESEAGNEDEEAEEMEGVSEGDDSDEVPELEPVEEVVEEKVGQKRKRPPVPIEVDDLLDGTTKRRREKREQQRAVIEGKRAAFKMKGKIEKKGGGRSGRQNQAAKPSILTKYSGKARLRAQGSDKERLKRQEDAGKKTTKWRIRRGF